MQLPGRGSVNKRGEGGAMAVAGLEGFQGLIQEAVFWVKKAGRGEAQTS